MSKEQFGFKFWLSWILWFAGSFVVSALAWTTLITQLFGTIRGVELTLTWSLAVFGTWFILITPFMRKKEQIWKRLNIDEEKAVDAWLQGLGTFVSLIVLSALAWAYYFKAEITAVNHSGLHSLWAQYVFGTWLIFLLPFLVFMYKKADKIFKAAEQRQGYTGTQFKAVFVDKEKRTLPTNLQNKIKNFPETLENGHVLNLIMNNGQQIPNVFVLNKSEILGIYDVDQFDMNITDIKDVELMGVQQLPVYDEKKWLRLDGRV